MYMILSILKVPVYEIKVFKLASEVDLRKKN